MARIQRLSMNLLCLILVTLALYSSARPEWCENLELSAVIAFRIEELLNRSTPGVEIHVDRGTIAFAMYIAKDQERYKQDNFTIAGENAFFSVILKRSTPSIYKAAEQVITKWGGNLQEYKELHPDTVLYIGCFGEGTHSFFRRVMCALVQSKGGHNLGITNVCEMMESPTTLPNDNTPSSPNQPDDATLLSSNHDQEQAVGKYVQRPQLGTWMTKH